MGRSEKDTLDGPSIEAMLRGLTERPNVQSTLILSKKDGSIIRATGFDASEKPNTSNTGQSYQWSPAQGGTERSDRHDGNGAGIKVTSETNASQDEPKTVEVLASSIFDFVNSASALGLTLGTTSRLTATSDRTPRRPTDRESTTTERNPEDEIESRNGADEVQLLRLRTKHQEIIIFPDPNYICCVVQRVGKAGNAPDRR